MSARLNTKMKGTTMTNTTMTRVLDLIRKSVGLPGTDSSCCGLPELDPGTDPKLPTNASSEADDAKTATPGRTCACANSERPPVDKW